MRSRHRERGAEPRKLGRYSYRETPNNDLGTSTTMRYVHGSNATTANPWSVGPNCGFDDLTVIRNAYSVRKTQEAIRPNESANGAVETVGAVTRVHAHPPMIPSTARHSERSEAQGEIAGSQGEGSRSRYDCDSSNSARWASAQNDILKRDD